MKKIGKFLTSSWGIIIVSCISLILGSIAAGGGKWNGLLAFGIFFLWFVFLVLAMGNNWFNEEKKRKEEKK